MDDDAAERLVLHPEHGSLSVLHLEIVGGIIQLEAFRSLDLHGVVGAVLKGQERTPVFIGGNGVDQLIVDLADLKGDVGDALSGIIRIDFDDLHAADGVIVIAIGNPPLLLFS